MSSYVVTGTSRGLGLATVTFLASSPKTDVKIVFATARSQTPALKELIAESSGRVVFVEMETTDQVGVDNAVKIVEKQLGGSGLDVLINNAGIGGFAEGWTDKL
jgi:NAD(P)-dependent dehydrogenase (short-subunit alcohol dehydrogenase family)